MLHFANAANEVVKKGINISAISKTKARAEISRMKGVKDSEIESAGKRIKSAIDSEFAAMAKDYERGDQQIDAKEEAKAEPKAVPKAETKVEAKGKR